MIRSFYLFGMALLAMVLFGATVAGGSVFGSVIFGSIGTVLAIAAVHEKKRVKPFELRHRAAEMLRSGKVQIDSRMNGDTHCFDYNKERGAWQYTRIDAKGEPPIVIWKNVFEATTTLYVVLLENAIMEGSY